MIARSDTAKDDEIITLRHEVTVLLSAPRWPLPGSRRQMRLVSPEP